MWLLLFNFCFSNYNKIEPGRCKNAPLCRGAFNFYSLVKRFIEYRILRTLWHPKEDFREVHILGE